MFKKPSQCILFSCGAVQSTITDFFLSRSVVSMKNRGDEEVSLTACNFRQSANEQQVPWSRFVADAVKANFTSGHVSIVTNVGLNRRARDGEN